MGVEEFIQRYSGCDERYNTMGDFIIIDCCQGGFGQ